jgi:dolichol-phosphate mannosyltransferase
MPFAPPASAQNGRYLVSVATYNERENLAGLAAEILAQIPHADLLVVDDNSPDGTGNLADELAARDPRIHVIHRSGKLGLGTAIIAAMKYALANGYDFLINMDADFSHHPRYLPAMVAKSKSADVVLGSRYVPGGGVRNWPLSRYLISSGVNFLSRVLLGLWANDVSGGYRCYRTARLRELNLDDIWSRGYSFQEELLYRCRRVGCKLAEVPIVFEDRRVGKSKANVRESARSLMTLLALALHALVTPEP